MLASATGSDSPKPAVSRAIARRCAPTSGSTAAYSRQLRGVWCSSSTGVVVAVVVAAGGVVHLAVRHADVAAADDGRRVLLVDAARRLPQAGAAHLGEGAGEHVAAVGDGVAAAVVVEAFAALQAEPALVHHPADHRRRGVARGVDRAGHLAAGVMQDVGSRRSR